MDPTLLMIEVPQIGTVSAPWQSPPRPFAWLALAHGAGAGTAQRTITAIADGLERVKARCRHGPQLRQFRPRRFG